MSAFAAAVDGIFADSSMAADAVWTPAAGGAGVAVRVIRRQPDEGMTFGPSRALVPTMIVDVRASQVAAPAKGDSVVIGASSWRVQGAPAIDRERLVWTAELVPA